MQELLEKLPKFYDEYDRRARLLPGLLVLSPLIFSVWAWFPEITTWSIVISILISCGGPALLARTVRDRGKKKEDSLYRSVNRKLPTTTMLRHRDDIIDPFTKQRYHDILQKKINNISFPCAEVELENPALADHQYDSAINWLKEKTRNTKEFPLVKEELINYGFARNLWGMKQYGLSLSLLMVITNCFIIYSRYEMKFQAVAPILWVSLIFCIGIVFWWIAFVKKNMVISTANAYARSLLAACERL